jgi:hypothetical protein
MMSCKKDLSSQTAEPPKTFTTKQEAKLYLNKKLNEYSMIIAKLAQDPEMKNWFTKEFRKNLMAITMYF